MRTGNNPPSVSPALRGAARSRLLERGNSRATRIVGLTPARSWRPCWASRGRTRFVGIDCAVARSPTSSASATVGSPSRVKCPPSSALAPPVFGRGRPGNHGEHIRASEIAECELVAYISRQEVRTPAATEFQKGPLSLPAPGLSLAASVPHSYPEYQSRTLAETLVFCHYLMGRANDH
jgi:hypothetical protein